MIITLEFMRETDAARMFRRKDGSMLWIPRSVCKSVLKLPPVEGKPQLYQLDVEGWFARTKGLE
jgi:hypothetical protein